MLDYSLVAAAIIDIKSTDSKIWEILTTPSEIAKFLHGTETTTDWNVGSSITFEGTHQRRRYKDHGKILKFSEPKELEYSYYTPFSGLADEASSYSKINVALVNKENGIVELTWTQTGFSGQYERGAVESGIPPMLEIIKELAEAK